MSSSKYSRPCQIHQTHVHRIVETAPLKDGTGKEINALHDLVVQHLRALKSIGNESSGSFITSLLEMKLDPTNMFEWQWHSQEHNDVPDCQLIDFLNFCAQAAEAATEKKQRTSASAGRSVHSLHANTTLSDDCIACGGEKHQLYTCSKFCALPHSEN